MLLNVEKKSSHVFCILSLFFPKENIPYTFNSQRTPEKYLTLFTVSPESQRCPNSSGYQWVALYGCKCILLSSGACALSSCLPPLLPFLTSSSHPLLLSPSILKLRILQGPVFRGGHLHLDLVTSGMCCIHEPTAAVATGMRPDWNWSPQTKWLIPHGLERKS